MSTGLRVLHAERAASVPRYESLVRGMVPDGSIGRASDRNPKEAGLIPMFLETAHGYNAVPRHLGRAAWKV